MGLLSCGRHQDPSGRRLTGGSCWWSSVSPSWFRHAHASHALDRGAPIHLVQATLGHASH
jgi:site-specific recombinase XerD